MKQKFPIREHAPICDVPVLLMGTSKEQRKSILKGNNHGKN
jgi:hypothetical protein